MSTTTHSIGNKTFILDQDKAEAAFAAKKIINGRETMTFNLLPLKYEWAYETYKKMKANHWEPEDIPMQRDVQQWKSSELRDVERWIIKMGIGYFSAAEGIVGDNVLHVVRELVTAPELKLVLGMHAHEENIHADSLLYMISSQYQLTNVKPCSNRSKLSAERTSCHTRSNSSAKIWTHATQQRLPHLCIWSAWRYSFMAYSGYTESVSSK